MRLINYCIVVCLIAVVSTGQLYADTSQWLVGLSVGTTTLEPDTADTPFRLDQTGSTGYKFYLGYDLNNRITLEGFWSDLGEATFTNGGELSYTFYGLGGSYYFPENSAGSAVFVKAGAGQIDVSGDVPFIIENSVQLYAGVGLEVQFDNGYAIRGEYDYYDSDAQFFSLSLNKRFGKIRSVLPRWAEDMNATLGNDTDANTGNTGNLSVPEITVNEQGMSKLQEKDLIPAEKVEFNLPVKPKVALPVQQLTDFLGVIEDVFFIQGSAELTAESLPVLDQLARALMKKNDGNYVIIGHTDNVGDADLNKNLSLQRAMEVGRYLKSKGVDGGSLSYLGVGEEEPISRNETVEGRLINRRIELLLN